MREAVILVNGTEVGLSNTFKAQVIERRPGHPRCGQVVFETPETPNLILDAGLDRINSTLICDLFLYCAVGTGTTPVSRDSGSITATTSGTTLTASASFFSGGDVGRVLRFDTGEKAKIVTVVSDTQVTLSAVLNVTTPTEFTVWYVEQTGLTTEARRTNNYLTGAGNCGSGRSGELLTHQRTYDFPIETADVAYYEVGFSHTSTPGANLNARGLFTSAPVNLVAGQQLRVIYYFRVRTTPVSPRVREVAISGWPAKEYPVTVDPNTDLVTLVNHGFPAGTKVKFNGVVPPGGIVFDAPYYVLSNNADSFRVSTSPGGPPVDITSSGQDVILFTNTKGTEQLQFDLFSTVSVTTGQTVSNYSLGGNIYTSVCEPSVAKWMFVSDDATPLPSFPVTTLASYSGPAGAAKALSKNSYTLGSFFVTWSTTYATNEGNSPNLRKFYITDLPGSSAKPQVGLTFLFDMPQEKSSLYTLTVIWKFAWDREFF